MTISLGNAINCIKEDAHWPKKIFFGGLIFLLSSVASGFVSGLSANTEPTIGMFFGFVILAIAGMFLTGFIFQSMHKVMNSDKFQMVEWNENNLLLTGFKNCCALIGYSILATIIFMGITILVSLVIGLVLGLGSLFLKQVLGDTLVINIVSSLIGIVIGLYFSQFICVAFACYIKTLKFRDLIAYKKHYQIIKENIHTTWTLIGKNILYSLLFALIVVLLAVTVIGALLIPFVIFASYFVAFNLLVQYAKEVKIENYLQ